MNSTFAMFSRHHKGRSLRGTTQAGKSGKQSNLPNKYSYKVRLLTSQH